MPRCCAARLKLCPAIVSTSSSTARTPTPPEKWTNAVMTRRGGWSTATNSTTSRPTPASATTWPTQHPDVVARLRQAHEDWWAEIEPGLADYSPISLGNDAENPTKLDAMDVMGDVAWHQTHIVQAQKSTGKWTVDVEQPGSYRFALRRWPEELDLPIDAGISPDAARRHIYAPPSGECNTIHPTGALLRLFDIEETQDVREGDREAVFELSLDQTGVTELEAWFVEEEASGAMQGAYYVYVERL